MASRVFAQEGEVQPPVVVVVEYDLALVASLGDVMWDAHRPRSRQSCHSITECRQWAIPLKQSVKG